MPKDIVVTLDGPAGSGKTTLAKGLAERFGLPFLDTGLLYRAVARRMLDNGVDSNDLEGALREARALAVEDIEEDRLRGDEVGQRASVIAVRPEVRSILLPFQQLFAGQKGGAVLVGRDTGTVICPEAFMKFFIVASVEARAERRFKELQERGVETMYEQVLAELVERDRRDSDRDVAPLRAAPDAVLLDTTDMDIETALVQAVAIVEARVRDEWHDKPNVWR